MDIGYISKVLEKSEQLAQDGYWGAKAGSSEEMAYDCAQKVFDVLLAAIKEVEPPKNKK